MRVVTSFTARRDVGEQRPPSDGDQRVRASLERRLARWRRRHPDLRIDSVAVNGSILDYLARNQRSVQLVVAGSRASHHVDELTGPAGNAVLHRLGCSVLIVDRRHL